MANAVPARNAFTEEDIRTLVRGPTDDERAVAAHRLCRRMEQAPLTEQERIAANEVLRLMAADSAEIVRRALAVTLRASTLVPHDVALKLAKDIDSIAVPVLTFSPAFSDDELAAIVRDSGATKQVAVAARATLSETVTNALSTHGSLEAVKTAIANDNARFSAFGLETALDRYGADSSLASGMAYRKVLPLSVAERLVDLVSEQVRKHLVDRHALSADTAMRIALGTQERATVDLVDQAGRAADMGAFVAHLQRQARLTPSLMLRALAQGHMSFFEHAVATLAEVPHHRAWLLVHDAGPLGLRAVYERAGLPPRLFPVFRAAVDTYHSLSAEAGVADAERFQSAMLERFLTQPGAAPREDMDYLIERLDQLNREQSKLSRGSAQHAAAA